MKTYRLAIAWMLVMGAMLCAQDPAPKPPHAGPLGELVHGVWQGSGLPALGGAVVHADGRIEIGVAGHRAAGRGDPVEVGDIWHLGSCTKALTAVLAGVLVDQGAVRFEDALAAKLFPAEDKVQEASRGAATLEQLLHHRAGFPSNFSRAVSMREQLEAPLQSNPPARRARVREAILGEEGSVPGLKFLYSNLSYTAAGSMLEEAGGGSYEELLVRHVLTPLGVQRPVFGPPGHDVEAPRTIFGHRKAADGFSAVAPGPGADNPALITAAGRLALSLEDWGRTIVPWLNPETERAGFPSPATRQRMLTPPEGADYAMGWVRTEREWGGGHVWTHSGSNTVWYCVVWMAPSKGFAVLATVNAAADPAKATADRLCGRLIEAARAPASPK